MTREEVKLKLNSPVTTEEAIEIFNWYIQNEAPVIVVEHNGVDYWLDKQVVEGIKGPRGLALLDYSMSHIKRILNEKQD